MIVDTVKGKIEGSRDGNTIRFAGIPYAKAPVGALRFRSPESIAPWEGVYKATGYKKDPMQYSRKKPFSDFSEDCLYLNIWVPEDNNKKYPVLVWIPGGAYAIGGSGASTAEGPSLYEGAPMAKDMDAIVVTISYRLNVFGFLNLSSFSNRFEDNLGLKDIIKALEWIKENIEAFNGENDNITLFGESAGAGCISTLLMMNSARNLFNRVIMQSNCLGSYYTVEEELQLCKKYLEILDIDEDHADELLNKSYEELYNASSKLDEYALKEFFPRCTFCPVVDKAYVSDYPTLGDFQVSNIDVLIGSNRYEGNFLRKSMNMTKKDSVTIAKNALHRLSDNKVKEILSKYALPGKQAIADVITDVMYTFPKIRLAERFSDHGTVYMYRYDYSTPMMKLLGYKACHVAEMIPLWNINMPPFDLLRAFGESSILRIGKRMRRYWGSFAATGVPSESWKPYNKNDRFTMIIDKNDRLDKNPEIDCLKKYEGLDRVVV